MNQPKRYASAIVYSETVVYSAPTRLVDQAPYQLAIIEFPDKQRLTVRIALESANAFVQIGDQVLFVEEKGGVCFYRPFP